MTEPPMTVPPWPERPLGDRAFEVVPGVVRIPAPTGFPVGDVNLYWIDGPEPVLIDAGVAGRRSLDALEAGLAQAGRRLADVRILLLTHSHADHAGSAAAIRAASGCAVRIHPRGLARVERAFEDLAAGRSWFGRFLARSGFSAATIEKQHESARLLRAVMAPCPGATPLEPGTGVDAGGRRLAVHASAGHASCHLTFVLEDEGVAFTGDHVLPHITPNPTLESAREGESAKPLPLVEYRESLPRIGRLPVRVACPAHGLPFADLAGRCREILDQQRRRVEKVHALLAASGPMTRKDLSRALFGGVRPGELYLTLSETSAAVELLVHDGRARVEEAPDVDRIHALP